MHKKKILVPATALSLKFFNKYTSIESLDAEGFYESVDMIEAILMYLLYSQHLVGNDNRLVRRFLKFADKLGQRYLKDLSHLSPKKRKKIIRRFAKHHRINLQSNRWHLPLDQYMSRDAFFSRKYHPDHPNHPAKVFGTSAKNPRALCSPCECKIVAFTSVQQSTEFWIKNKKFQLENVGLGKHWRRYERHPMCIFRLAMYDYHRYHAPVSGKVVESRSIETRKPTHGVRPSAWKSPHFNLLNDNKRHVLTLKTAEGYYVALVFVGAPAVKSIQFHPHIKVGRKVRRGEDLGSFHFGGSTVAMFTTSTAMQFDERILKKSRKKKELQVKCGQRVGTV